MIRHYPDELLLPLSGLQHYAFCERQWALIYLERQWDDNVQTMEGHHLHAKVHSGLQSEVQGDVVIARSVPLVSYRLGIYGVADVVEYHPTTRNAGIILPGLDGFWRPHPVEYKRGRPKAFDWDEVQLCAQAMCLEEMSGVSVPVGSFYYGRTRRRLKVEFTAELRKRVTELAKEMHHAFNRGITPPAPRGARCSLCSLKDLCVPKLTRRKRSVRAYVRKFLAADG